MIKDPFYRQLFLNIGIISVTIVLAVVGLSLLLSDVGAKADLISKYRATTALRNTNLTAIVDLQKNAAEASVYQKAIDRLLPKQDDLIGFPQKVQTLAASYNTNAQITFAGEPTSPANGVAGFVAFNLNVSGQLGDTLAFLKNLETQSPQFLVAIDTTDFSSDGSSGNITASGRVFFQ